MTNELQAITDFTTLVGNELVKLMDILDCPKCDRFLTCYYPEAIRVIGPVVVAMKLQAKFDNATLDLQESAGSN